MMIIKDWLVRRGDGVFDVDVDVIYPRMTQALIEYGKKIDPAKATPGSGKALLATAASLSVDKLDQYWLEVIYQMTKLEAQRLIFRTELDTRSDATPALVFHFRTQAKARWRHQGRPPGRGIRKATEGKEARLMFEELRGAIPR
jgi:hypothetical protein